MRAVSSGSFFMAQFTKALMCPPDYFSVKYEINQWMRKNVRVSPHRARKQWVALHETIKSFLEIPVTTLKPQEGLPDMVFATDQGVVIADTFIASNFYYRQRRQEVRFYTRWFADQGYQIKTLPQECFFEGGDILPWRESLLVGYGFRTQKRSLSPLAWASGKRLIPLRLVNPWFYHLDTALLPLDEETFLWYPEAFSVASQQRLNRLGADLISVSSHDARNFVLNSLVRHKRILVGKGMNGTLDLLLKRGWRVHQVEVSEFIKSGGGIHCLVCQL